MVQRFCLLLFAAGLCLLTSCARAQQYKAVPQEAKGDRKADENNDSLFRYSWLEPAKVPDLPLVFVPDSSAEWKNLPGDWNLFPPLETHLGVPATPIQAVAAVGFLEANRVIKIKVPRGLPDPTPHVPALNPLTHGKWRLGKALFFTPMLKAGGKSYACATCHDPRHGFAEDPSNPPGAKYNTLSLINVVYNRRQFWDGRVGALEETLFRGLDDERPMDPDKRLERGLQEHVWGGFVRSLVDEKRFNEDFLFVFGIARPTQDAVAQALATYMRTILSGDSLYDQAANGKPPTAAQFAPLLKDEVTASSLRETIGSKTPRREEMPALLATGFELYQKHCAQCHPGPLFTDHDYHNVGYGGKDQPDIGVETGRSVRVPVGMTESRLNGAFRTPTLRNLVVTNPYFHDGSQRTLREVVEFFDDGISMSRHLAPALKDGEHRRRLHLMPPEIDALVIFLRSLQGRPVSPIVALP
jgi:cytochrome c peroxidase